MDKKVNVKDLLKSESEVLKRIAEELDLNEGTVQAGHYSHTSGHTSSGGHTSQTAKVEKSETKE